MVIKIGGSRKRTRHKFKKHIRRKGKISLSKYFQTFENGDFVSIKAEPAIQTGSYYVRFHGRKGKIVGKRGRHYLVQVMDGSVAKKLILHPVHLSKIQVTKAAAASK
ncbi:50S ribosomal protein L21e [Candidatus Woesearchaeota archaeon]|nr:50S ribosomal protein L21e [Candidatus Woesearchaeota archaeon]